MNKTKTKLPLLIIGVALIGVAISLLRLADFGTDPFTTMNLGISSFMGVSFGNLQLLVNILLLVSVTFISRNYIGIGTIVNMVLVGYISDFFILIFSSMSEFSLSLITRIILLVIGLVMSSLGVAMYMHSDMGVAPYDAIPAIIENKTNKKIPFNKGRMFIDFLAIFIGFLFGATIGVGTIITACFMGPLIQYYKDFFEIRYSLKTNV